MMTAAIMINPVMTSNGLTVMIAQCACCRALSASGLSRFRSRDGKLISAVWAEHRSLAEGMVDTTDLDCRFPHCLRASPNTV